MKKIQVLVATVNQRNFSLAEKMNIRCDTVIANQSDSDEIQTKSFPYGNIKMITTSSKGVGKNRNIALEAATEEIVLFADDDVKYNDDMPEQVYKAFQQNPDADIIIFSMDYTRNGELIEQRHLENKRRNLHNSMRFGAVSIAARADKLQKKNIIFNENFGGGCKYCTGEDSIFLSDCFRKKLHVYSNEYVLGECSRDSSSWFEGCDEKYFYDKGALMRFLFPKFKYIMTMYFAINFKKETDISLPGRVKLMYEGLRNSRKMITYSECSKIK